MRKARETTENYGNYARQSRARAISELNQTARCMEASRRGAGRKRKENGRKTKAVKGCGRERGERGEEKLLNANAKWNIGTVTNSEYARALL